MAKRSVGGILQHRQNGNLEAIVLEGKELWHWWKAPNTGWQHGQRISANASDPGCFLQSPRTENFEVLVREGSNLVRYTQDTKNPAIGWKRAETITNSATGGACLIERHDDKLEALVQEGKRIVSYIQESGKWQRRQTVSTKATDRASVIPNRMQSDRYDALVLEGKALVHYFRIGNATFDLWQRGTVVSIEAIGPAYLIQGTLGASNFEAVVPEVSGLVHYFKDNNSVSTPWQRARTITTAAPGAAVLVQTSNGMFHVLTEERTQSVVHYQRDNRDLSTPWLRGQQLRTEPQIAKLPPPVKICQLTGEASPGKSLSRFNVKGTDLGASFPGVNEKGEKTIYFLFGDTWGPGWDRTDLDCIGFTSEPTAYQGLSLAYHKSPPRIMPPVPQGGFNVPLDGFMQGRDIYAFFSTDTRFLDGGAVMGRSLFTHSTDYGQTYQTLYTLSSTKFVNVSVEVRDLPGIGLALSIIGSGRYRASDIYFAYIPIDRIRDRGAVRFFAGNPLKPRWSAKEEDAVPLFPDGTVGELSCRWNPFLKCWLLLYNGANPRGIHLRRAPNPWGPWSNPVLALDVGDAYGRIMHAANQNDGLDDTMFGGAPRRGEWGGEYGPYQITPYCTGVPGRYTRLHFCLSTWNPYQVMQMRTDITMDGKPVDPRAWATGRTASGLQKYAAIATLMAEQGAGLKWSLPLHASTLSADHLEWATYRTEAERKSELKATFTQLIELLPTDNARADAYTILTLEMVRLGAPSSAGTFDKAGHQRKAVALLRAGERADLLDDVAMRIEGMRLG